MRGFVQIDASKSSEHGCRCRGLARAVNKEKAEKHVLVQSTKVDVLDINVTWEQIYFTIVINRMAHQPEIFFLLRDQTSFSCLRESAFSKK